MKKLAIITGLILLFALISCNKVNDKQVNEIHDTVSQEITHSTQEIPVEEILSDQQSSETVKQEESSSESKEAEGVESMEKQQEDTMKKTESEDAMMKKQETKSEVIESEKEVNNTSPQADGTPKQEEKAVEIPGTYTTYSDSLVGATADTVIFFHAGWCPSCRAADASISAGDIPSGLTILKADYDSQIDLKKKYGVVAQHTFVHVDANGNLIRKWLGGTKVEDIIEKL